jgi:hypothetical protein
MNLHLHYIHATVRAPTSHQTQANHETLITAKDGY